MYWKAILFVGKLLNIDSKVSHSFSNVLVCIVDENVAIAMSVMNQTRQAPE